MKKIDSDKFTRMPKQTPDIFPISELDRAICKYKPNSLSAIGVYSNLANLKFCREFERSNRTLIRFLGKLIQKTSLIW